MFSDYLDTIAFVSKYDPQVGEAMEAELKRQRRNLELSLIHISEPTRPY